MLLILQKSMKSMQLVLNEFFQKLGSTILTASASAYTQSRSKILHTGFVELNKKAIVQTYYEDDDYRKYKGFRLLAVDGSKIRLPNEREINNSFGTIKIKNQSNVEGQYAGAVASVLYDVLNNIAIDAILAPARAYEVKLAMEHLEHVRSNDLTIFDRGYISYIFLASQVKAGNQYLGRCSKGSFSEAQEMFYSDAASRIVTLSCPRDKRKEARALELPLEIKVRLIRIILDTGEVEVLVTSLLDEEKYPTEDFKELYYKRWGIETFYGTLKGRLNLENFTGKTVESVKQDFYSTIFISGLESILTEDAQKELDAKKENKNPQQVNKAVSFNAIKNNVIELFYKENDNSKILEQLTELFKTNPVIVRKERKVERKESSPKVLLNYHKRLKKLCF